MSNLSDICGVIIINIKMKNTIKNFAILALVIFTGFSFTSIGGNKKEIKTD